MLINRLFFYVHMSVSHASRYNSLGTSGLLEHIDLFFCPDVPLGFVLTHVELADLGGAVGRISVTTIQRGVSVKAAVSCAHNRKVLATRTHFASSFQTGARLPPSQVVDELAN
jgi:hypothetical protein